MSTDEDAEDTSRAIMEATYRALCEHGYASLTMQDIADESGTSKSLLHYHYDTKEGLLTAFIEDFLDDFEERIETADDVPPDERLREFLDWFVSPLEDDRRAFHTAFLELRSQAPFNEGYRGQLKRSDELARNAIADIVEDGIDAGVFRADADPESVALLIFATMDGARVREVTLAEDGYADSVRDALSEYVIDDLLVEEAE